MWSTGNQLILIINFSPSFQKVFTNEFSRIKFQVIFFEDPVTFPTNQFLSLDSIKNVPRCRDRFFLYPRNKRFYFIPKWNTSFSKRFRIFKVGTKSYHGSMNTIPTKTVIAKDWAGSNNSNFFWKDSRKKWGGEEREKKKAYSLTGSLTFKMLFTVLSHQIWLHFKYAELFQDISRATRNETIKYNAVQAVIFIWKSPWAHFPFPSAKCLVPSIAKRRSEWRTELRPPRIMLLADTNIQ